MTERLEDVLHYYRDKSDKIEQERTEWLQQLNYMKQSVQNVHLKEKEVLQKKIQIAEMQRGLSESHIMMFDEKLHELMLIKDNEELRKADEKDRIKIKELMALAEEYRTDNDPHKVKVSDSRPVNTKKESLAIERNNKSKKDSKQTYASKYKQSMKMCKNKQSGRIKTIFLPHEDVNRLRGQIERLKEYKEDQKKLYNQCLAAYEKDKKIKAEEIKLRKKDFEQKYAQLKAVVEHRNKQKEEICRQYFQERHRVKEQTMPSIDALRERLETTKKILETKLEEEKNRLEREIAYKVENLQKHAEDYTNKFRNEVKKKEHKVNILKEQYMHLQKVYVENLKALEIEYESYVQREESIEFRRDRESATLREDVLVLEKRIAEYEIYIKKLKDLVDKDKAEDLIEELTTNEDKQADLIEIREEINKLKEEIDHARRVKI